MKKLLKKETPSAILEKMKNDDQAFMDGMNGDDQHVDEGAEDEEGRRTEVAVKMKKGGREKKKLSVLQDDLQKYLDLLVGKGEANGKKKKETNKNSDDDMESSDSSNDEEDEDEDKEDKEDKERLISSDMPSLQSRTPENGFQIQFLLPNQLLVLFVLKTMKLKVIAMKMKRMMKKTVKMFI
jgi:hypothetical protein